MRIPDPSLPLPPTSPSAPRHVLADHAGRGGVTVPVPAPRPGLPLGPGLLALADVLLATRERACVLGDLAAWRDGALTWLRVPRPATRVVMEHLDDPATLPHLPPAADGGTGRFLWTITDHASGQVAARAFGDHAGPDTTVAVQGAALLGSRLRRPLLVRLVDGGVVFTRPAPGGRIEVGARVSTHRAEPVGADDDRMATVARSGHSYPRGS